MINNTNLEASKKYVKYHTKALVFKKKLSLIYYYYNLFCIHNLRRYIFQKDTKL